jgi:hydrogenase large subunit
MTRFAIDPVTRVNGHLRIEVDAASGTVRDAWSSGQMFRGIERILEGRDPREAWLLAQRICGACGSVHGSESVRAVENALGVTIPSNARLIRNLMAGSQAVVSHAAGFYLRQAPDWVDPTAAVRADPAPHRRWLARRRSAERRHGVDEGARTGWRHCSRAHPDRSPPATRDTPRTPSRPNRAS